MRHDLSEIMEDGRAYHGVMTVVRRVNDRRLESTTRHIAEAVS
jgi:hypothetical protein